jgi:hypothetical protein
MNGDDFSRPTADLLAKRAGHTCSNPNCRAKTIGPSLADPNKSANVGVAAHITASRLGGARYETGLTSEQRRDAANGIWLCQTCSRLIDVNDGVDYPVDVLRKWKAEHEASIASTLGKAVREKYHELGGKVEASGIGNITGADIRKPTRIQPGTHISASGIGNITGVRIGGKDE